LERGALSDESFRKLADKYVLFCHVTSQVPTDPHQNLMGKKGGQGFPFLAFLNSEGSLIAVHGGPRTVKSFEATGARTAAYLEVEKKADAGDAGAKVEMLLQQIELGRTTLKRGKGRLKEAGGELSKEQQARLEALEATAEVSELARAAGRDPQKRAEAGKKCLEMKKAGRVPSGHWEKLTWWLLIMDCAEAAKDAPTFEEALKGLKDHVGDEPGVKKLLEEKEAVLKGMSK
jgi:hypothetical protein